VTASQIEPAVRVSSLVELVRDVNRRIAARSTIGVVALACECESRLCEAAFEVPLSLFQVVDARPGFYLVARGHEGAAGQRVVRRDGGYVVVEQPS
jgi:hypothetical protein